jgi:hypothetical protein
MDTFKHAFKFISEDKTRYFMNGIHVVSENGKIRFEATDGRTGLKSDPVMGNSDADFNCIVKDITKFLPLNMIHFKITERMIEYSNDIYRLAVFNIDGQFPNIARVIPDLKDYDKLSFDKTEFKNSLERLVLELKMKGRIKPAQTRVHLKDGCIFTDEETAVSCSISCDTGFPEDTQICIALLYMNMITDRIHDYEFWINKENPENRAVCVVDKVLCTTEITMPMSLS